jgi:hypothetical protein
MTDVFDLPMSLAILSVNGLMVPEGEREGWCVVSRFTVASAINYLSITLVVAVARHGDFLIRLGFSAHALTCGRVLALGTSTVLARHDHDAGGRRKARHPRSILVLTLVIPKLFSSYP